METRRIAARISEVRARINHFLIRELKARGIEGLVPSHGGILFHLFSHDAETMKELAKAVRRDKSTITALVGKLVSHGYVQKESNSADQRSILVRLTPRGKALQPAFQEISDQLLERIWQGIKESEQEEVISILKKIESNLA